VNWPKTLGQPQAVLSQYANLRSLRALPHSSIVATASTTTRSGPGGADRATTVTITNTSASTVAFLLRADVRRGTTAGQELAGHNELQSSLWQNNDITLFPGGSQTLTVTWNSADLQGATPVVNVSGWNVPKIDILA
jgi:exo-1,4-beta-D-glucosaminidase